MCMRPECPHPWSQAIRFLLLRALRERLQLPVKRHQPGLDAELRMAVGELAAEFGGGFAVSLGLRSGIDNGSIPIGDLCSAAVAVIDDDDLLDAVQLDRGAEVIPECLVPILERGRHDADGCAGERELAVLSGEL